ncbi:MAG: methanogenesis marker protein Mmp4/MtxX [Methanolinea sp.]|nr:methanogenesis marker protein Mmp4/MtxX [Methanolinea sp.]
MSVKMIGIGIEGESEKIVRSVLRSHCAARTVCYCCPGVLPGEIEVAVREDPHPEEALIRDLYLGNIHAAVRGTLPANATLAALKRMSGVDRLERAALLETEKGTRFLLAPVGVDEGWTVQEKVSLVRRAESMARFIGLSGGVAILSGGRLGDAGRHPRVDESMAQAELVARLTGARHFQILIEEAVKQCSVILAPDGISGNLIFRTLTFLGSGHGHGAPVLNIDRIFVDTSRASPEYVDALHLADSLSIR